MNIILFGPYGSGKGTQAKMLEKKFDMKVFDTGAVLRQSVKEETELGIKVKEIMNNGELVSDNLIMEITEDWIKKQNKNDNILFDGIPRTLEQSNILDKILKNNNIEVKRIFINIPYEESIKRQTLRRICSDCKKIFPASYSKNICDECNGKLETRAENDPLIAKKRADSFEKTTMPIIEKYRKLKNIIEIDGMLDIEKVKQSILNNL
jgi:adenylate kinase